MGQDARGEWEWLKPDWAAWRVFVKVLFGLPLADAAELDLFRLCTGLTDYVPRASREGWVPVGRRGGKSRVLAMIACYLALCFDWTPYLAPGEIGYISVLADQRSHASAIMNYIKGALRHPRLASLVRKPLVETIELEPRVTIEVVTASIKAVRSRTVIAALCDEIAFWEANEDCANPDVEILNGLRPAMMTIPGSLLLAASSRYARRGALWNNFRDWYGKPEGPLVWSADTMTMHPSVDREWLAAEFERDPVAAAAEYGLEFRTDVGALVDPDVARECVVRGRHELPPDRRFSYRAFVDPSGGSGDSMTLAIAHDNGERPVLDALREVRPPFQPDQVVSEFAGLLKAYLCFEVTGDHYGGEWPAERFLEHGIAYAVSERTKSEIYLEFLPMINARKPELLDHQRCLLQLDSLERRTARSGRDSVDHPPGGHDDVINVAAGALVELDKVSTGGVIIPGEVLAWSRTRA